MSFPVIREVCRVESEGRVRVFVCVRCYHVGSEGCVSILVMKGVFAPTLGLRGGCGHVGFLVLRVSGFGGVCVPV